MNRPKHPKAQQFVGQKLFDEISCFRDLETRIEHLPTEQQRGDAFEVFAEAYFATQRIVAAKHVWPDKRISPSLRARLKLHSRDVGADGVIETVAGKYRGYQAKFRTGRTPLTWTEVATFFGVTDHCDDRLLFTNSEDVSEVTDARKDFSSIRGTDLDSLGVEDFDAIRRWLEGGQIVREKHPPRPYQQQALDAILPALKQQDRATAVMACGTGKTFVALWVAESVAKRTVLVLVPSLALLRQTLREWVNNTTWERFDYLCVCSDPTVSQGGDELIVRPTELEFSVSTQPEQVREFLAHSFAGVKIIFSTYQSADVVARGMPRNVRFDIGIFDEAHKTAGREGAKFSFALKDENLPIRKRLFLTATPRHYDLRKRDKEGEPVEVYSMNRPEIYGPVVHTLSFAEAAKDDIICKYKVVISVVTSAMLNQHQLRHGTVLVNGDEVKAQQVANQIALAQAVAEHQLKKIFTFHRNVASARSFTSEGGEGIGTHLPEFAALHVNGAMSTAARDGLMTEFKAARQAVMSNARCLTEGIDVPTVDMVAFLTPKRSKVDIVQAVGRAMRNAPGKTTGYILVPLYVEQAADESLDAAVARAEFDEVWAVLQALQEQDEVLDDLIHQMQAERRLTKGFNDSRLRERVEVLGPTLTLDKLRRAIATRCLDRLARPWDEMVQVLVAYKKQHCHPRVPKDAPAPWTELGLWVDHVRALKRWGELSAARQAQLDQLGFCWRVDGETLDSVEGLLNEHEFRKASGLTKIEEYRKQGLITPVGTALSVSHISFFYQPRQIAELKKALGITLDSIEGLLNEDEFRTASGLTSIAAYRQQGLIKPVGCGLAKGCAAPFYYHPRQIGELKKNLGITLDSTEGLLNESKFQKASGLANIAKYRQQGLIKPVGKGMSSSKVSFFYHPRQVSELKEALGITLDCIEGLLNETEFMKASGLTSIAAYRQQGLIKPVGCGLSKGHAAPSYYHPRQIGELKKTLGITLDRTEGLLNETKFMKASGLTMIAKYRQQGLIKPVGKGMSSSKVSFFYHPRQVSELKEALGITLDSTEGLFHEEQFIRISGLTNTATYRKRGLIKPVGFEMAGPNVSAFYHPRQIAELRKVLEITLDNTEGLMNESEFRRVSGFTNIAKYRQQGLIKPVGKGMSSSKVSFFYHSRQVSELKEALGITLDSIEGLLTETEFKHKSGLTNMAQYRKRGLITPFGKGVSASKISFFYHPRQIAELKQRLAELRSR